MQKLCEKVFKAKFLHCFAEVMPPQFQYLQLQTVRQRNCGDLQELRGWAAHVSAQDGSES